MSIQEGFPETREGIWGPSIEEIEAERRANQQRAEQTEDKKPFGPTWGQLEREIELEEAPQSTGYDLEERPGRIPEADSLIDGHAASLD